MALSTPLEIAQTTTRDTVHAELTGAKRDWVGALFLSLPAFARLSGGL